MRIQTDEEAIALINKLKDGYFDFEQERNDAVFMLQEYSLNIINLIFHSDENLTAE